MTAKILITELMDKIFIKYLLFSLFTMPALVLIVHRGVSISASTILLLSLIVLIIRYPIDITLNKKEKILIYSLLFLPLVVAFDVTLRGLSLRYLDYYLRFILVIPIYLAIREVKVNLTPLIIGILTGAIGGGVFALYQKYYLHEDNAHGYILKIIFGNISLLLGVMSLASLFIVEEIRFKKTLVVISLLAFILGVTGSILSATRGGWIAIPFFVGLFVMYFPTQKVNKIIGVTALIIVMLITYYTNSGVKSRVSLAYHNTETYFTGEKSAVVRTAVGARLELWKAAWIIFTENPVFGIGSGEVKQALKKKKRTGEIKRISSYDHVHNEALQILVTTGIVGFIAYIILYAGIAYYFYRTLIESNINRVRYLSFLGLMMVGAYFIFGLTNYSFGHHVMVVFFAVMVAVFAGIISSIENKEKEYYNRKKLDLMS
ncbi:MAG: hypothetical protein GQ529_11380 [Methyloprofundus sp.]|nr:hypothetical protein [Methyloprofundus sp.]